MKPIRVALLAVLVLVALGAGWFLLHEEPETRVAETVAAELSALYPDAEATFSAPHDSLLFGVSYRASAEVEPPFSAAGAPVAQVACYDTVDRLIAAGWTPLEPCPEFSECASTHMHKVYGEHVARLEVMLCSPGRESAGYVDEDGSFRLVATVYDLSGYEVGFDPNR